MTGKLSPLALAGVAFVIGLGTILAAWAFQLIGGYQPCALCLQQRVPYYFGLPILALAIVLLWYWPHQALLARLFTACFSLIMLYGLGLAVYHAGAEWNFWQGPTDCGNTTAQLVENADDLLNQMQGIRLVSCTDAALRILGLSFAGWNAVVSLLLAGLGCVVTFMKSKQA